MDDGMKQIALLAALLAVLPLGETADAATSAVAQPRAQSLERQVDALFAKWNRPGMPGAVVGVIRDGKILLSKAYGLADLERNVPMTTASVITVGSMSKQFTAFSIHLLAQDGKLSLDDDIRKYVPEVPDFGATITIRHLLHHTSGLRDYFDLMAMTGTRSDDVTTQDDGLTLMTRQRALNFAPGQEHMYSNTGYMLLGLIVQRASGTQLADFARERIFEPLGMKHTRFLHGYGTVVPGRALSYLPAAAGGYEYVAVGDSADGAGGLVTTLGDLALWDRNFHDGRLGGMELIAHMQATGVLNDGKPIAYASGLVVGGYRGGRMVLHGGVIGGFQTMMARFPDQHLSVVVLANASDLDVWQMMYRITDLYLDREPGAAPAAPAAPRQVFKEIAIDPARLDALAGYYALSPDSGINFTREAGRLMAQGTGQPRIQAFAYGERAFFAKAIDAQFTFDPPGKDGIVAGGVLHQNGIDIPAQRVARPVPSNDALKRFEGTFYSDELGVAYTVASKDGALVLSYPRGTIDLGYNDKGAFATGLLGNIQYQCSVQEGCTGFTLTSTRVRNLRFTRLAPAAPTP
jgi:CubicO group peptidase (beta-lactamase class C family)